jgi:hypothetical protein
MAKMYPSLLLINDITYPLARSRMHVSVWYKKINHFIRSNRVLR